MAIGVPSQPLFGGVPAQESSDVSIAFQRGLRGLTGTSDILWSDLKGNFLEGIGFKLGNSTIYSFGSFCSS